MKEAGCCVHTRARRLTGIWSSLRGFRHAEAPGGNHVVEEVMHAPCWPKPSIPKPKDGSAKGKGFVSDHGTAPSILPHETTKKMFNSCAPENHATPNGPGTHFSIQFEERSGIKFSSLVRVMTACPLLILPVPRDTALA